MTITVSSGVTSSGLHVSSGDPVVVLSGGELKNTTILSGGSATLAAGALGRSLLVSGGGALLGAGDLTGSVRVAGALSGLTVGGQLNGQSTVEILAGGSANGVILADVQGENGFTEFLVDSGGSATGTVISSGAFFENYGLASATIVSAGGEADLFAGAVTVGDTVRFDGSEVVSSGGVASGTTVQRGGVEIVYSGGAASGAATQSGGTFDLYGGTATGVLIQSGGALGYFGDIASNLTAGQMTSATVLSGVTVSSGGFIDLENDTVLNGVTVSVRAGGIVEDMTVNAGAVVLGPGELEGAITVAGVISGVTIGDAYNNFNFVEIESGGAARSIILADVAGPYGGQTLNVDSGASVTGTVVSAASILADHGSARTTIVASGGVENVFSGGLSTSDTISNGGSALLFGGLAAGIIVRAGGVVSGLGTTSGARLHGGRETLSSGSYAAGTEVVSSGILTLLGGSTASGTQLYRGGRETVSSGSVASRSRVLDKGVIDVYADGTTVSTALSAGQEVVSSGGVASRTQVHHGGALYVFGGGEAFATNVSGSAKELVSSGAVTSGTTVLEGGTQALYAGAIASSTTISYGAKAVVASGATMVDPDLLSRGKLIDNGMVVMSGNGGLAGILSGSGQISEAGGVLVLDSDATKFTGSAVISGGTIELAKAGALGSAGVEFVEPPTGSSVLQVDAADTLVIGGTLANTLSDFDGTNESLDLRGVVYVSGATATVSGSQLVLTEGSRTYHFKLAGAVATDGYSVVSDGAGGTIIDPQVTAMAQAMAAFTAGSGGLAPAVSATSSSTTALFGATASNSRAGVHG